MPLAMRESDPSSPGVRRSMSARSHRWSPRPSFCRAESTAPAVLPVHAAFWQVERASDGLGEELHLGSVREYAGESLGAGAAAVVVAGGELVTDDGRVVQMTSKSSTRQ
jgi:hypothetical protein